MAQVFHRGANNIAKASIIVAILLGGVAFYVYTQIARSSYLTGRYIEKQQPSLLYASEAAENRER